MKYGFKKWKSKSLSKALLKPLKLERWKNPGKKPGKCPDPIEAFRSGEEWAFSEIYQKYEKPILKYVTDKVRAPDIAQELVQEVFIKVHRFRDSYQPQYAFSTWLWTIARNVVSDWYRAARPEQHLTSLPEDENFAFEERIPDTRLGAHDLLELKHMRRVLKTLFKKLTAPQRRVIWLRVIHQLSYDEISKQMGLSLSAVKCLAYRSKAALSELGHSPVWA